MWHRLLPCINTYFLAVGSINQNSGALNRRRSLQMCAWDITSSDLLYTRMRHKDMTGSRLKARRPARKMFAIAKLASCIKDARPGLKPTQSEQLTSSTVSPFDTGWTTPRTRQLTKYNLSHGLADSNKRFTADWKTLLPIKITPHSLLRVKFRICRELLGKFVPFPK